MFILQLEICFFNDNKLQKIKNWTERFIYHVPFFINISPNFPLYDAILISNTVPSTFCLLLYILLGY